jgi:hypothetical protein
MSEQSYGPCLYLAHLKNCSFDFVVGQEKGGGHAGLVDDVPRLFDLGGKTY